MTKRRQLLLFRIGCGIGEGYVNRIVCAAEEYGETLDKDLLLLEAYENALYQSGFGIVMLRDLDIEKPRIIVEVANSPTKDDKNGCEMFRGIITGKIATGCPGDASAAKLSVARHVYLRCLNEVRARCHGQDVPDAPPGNQENAGGA